MKSNAVKSKLVIILILCLVVSGASPSMGSFTAFSDTAGHWAEKEILESAAAQIIRGYEGKFQPNNKVTRAQFAVMIVNALGLENEAIALKGFPTGFSDLKSNHYAAGHILVARERGIISGYPDGTFKPQKEIRRDEITSVLIRALNLSKVDSSTGILNKFDDVEDVPNWAKPFVSQAVYLGFASGFPDNTFRPARNASRGETAVLINKFLKEMNREYTFVGEVKEVLFYTKELRIDIGGQDERFTYDTQTVFYYKDKKFSPEELQNGDYVAIILDQQGQLNYVEKLDNIKSPGGLVSEENGPFFQTFSVSNRFESSKDLKSDKSTSANVLVITKDGQAAGVKKKIEELGGKISLYYPSLNYLSASVETGIISSLANISGVDSINIDKKEQVVPQSTIEQNNTIGKDPKKSLEVTKQSILADVFSDSKKVDGKGQVIAILDTGIDPGHPDLQTTSDGKRKIIDWKDFTGEGLIDTGAWVKKTNKIISLVDGNYLVGSIVSKSDRFHYGYIREDLLGNGMDMNFNGIYTDIFAVLVVDSQESGLYDTVYVDTNRDKDFTDEVTLKVFADEPVYASFKSRDGRDIFNFNLSEVKSSGNEIQIGFDNNDHGTHVAGIATANGYVKGVAPGAQVMALKVLDSKGRGSWESVTEAMIYAVGKGADIINLSLGFTPEDFVGGSVPAKLINSLTEKYDVLFVVAAGNDGPRLMSLATPGDANKAISVGGFTSPQMWKQDFGWEVPEDNLWFFSGVGPRGDGFMAPQILAPGSAVSTVPMREGEQYFLSQGTSMATPHVSGSLALLFEAAKKNNVSISPLVVKRAVELGARPIPNYSYAEQGYGVINLVTAWRELQYMMDNPAFSLAIYNSVTGLGYGLYEERLNLGQVPWYLRNDSGTSKELSIYSHADWVIEKVDTVLVPPGQTREIPLEFNVPEEKGLHSALVRADDLKTYGVDVDLLTTVINPYRLSDSPGRTKLLSESLKPAQYKRYFFEVMPGSNGLEIQMDVLKNSEDSFKGKVRLYLYDPQGRKIAETDFAGEDSEKSTITVGSDNPRPGIWQVVVYSSASLSSLGLNQSEFDLKVSIPDYKEPDLSAQNRDIIVSMVPRDIPGDRECYVTLQIRNRDNKRPYQGAIEINGKLYYTRKGYITIPLNNEKKKYTFNVKSITNTAKFKPVEYYFELDT